jgi:hypothetical protein
MGELLRKLSPPAREYKQTDEVYEVAQSFRLREGEVQTPLPAQDGLNRIVCAASKLPNDIVLAGARHWDKTMHGTASWLKESCGMSITNDVQGFLDRYGNFHDRKEAWVIAFKAGQIIRRCGGDNGTLYSENLY